MGSRSQRVNVVLEFRGVIFIQLGRSEFLIDRTSLAEGLLEVVILLFSLFLVLGGEKEEEGKGGRPSKVRGKRKT